MFVCLLVCWSAFYRPHDICPLCGAVSEYSESSQAVAGGPARRAGKRMHLREHARACRTTNITSQQKNRRADAFQKQNRTRALVGADLGQLVYTYKRVVCVYLLVCLSVCLLFIGHTTFVHFAALPPSTPRAGAVAGGPARAARASMHSAESTRAHAVQLLNEKIAALMPFKNN